MYKHNTFEAYIWVCIHYQPFQYVVMAFTLGDLIELLEFTMSRKYSAQSDRAPHFVLKYCCLQITAINLVELAQCRIIFYLCGKKSTAVLIEASKNWNCSIMEQEYQHPQLSTPNQQIVSQLLAVSCITISTIFPMALQ